MEGSGLVHVRYTREIRMVNYAACLVASVNCLLLKVLFPKHSDKANHIIPYKEF